MADAFGPPGALLMDTFTFNVIAILIFLFCTVGYHGIYHFVTSVHPMRTVKGKMEAYRKDWMESVLASRNIIMAVQSIRNFIMATTWLAGSILLALAFFTTGGGGGASDFFNFVGAYDDGFLQYKLGLLLFLYGFAFLLFLLTLRHLVVVNSLLGVSPELITQVEGLEASEYLGQLLNRAHARFTYGSRSLYFSLPVVAWLFSTWAFIVFTVLIWGWVLMILDTRNAVFRPKRRYV
jgi:uncharacterized membrane protein